jgi:hypothetical protein
MRNLYVLWISFTEKHLEALGVFCMYGARSGVVLFTGRVTSSVTLFCVLDDNVRRHVT